MKIQSVLSVLLLGLAPLSGVGHASDFCQNAVKNINTAYQSYRSFADGSYDDDTFSNLVIKTLKDKQTLNCDWSELALNVAYSPDKHLMSMDWQVDGGGTMKEFQSVLQYQENNRLTVTNGSNGYVLEIHQMDIGGKPLYLVKDWSAGYTALNGQTINLYQIKNHTPTPAKLIKTKQGLTHTIGFAYNPFSIPDELDKLIEVNAKQKEFSIPVVIENEQYPEGEVTKRVLRYRYNGKQFVYIK